MKTLKQPPTTSNCKYIQSALLNLRKGDKQYDLFIVNTSNYEEKMRLHLHMPCAYTFMVHICSHIYVNTGQEIFLTMESILVNIQNKSFQDRIFSLVHKGRFYNEHFIFTS